MSELLPPSPALVTDLIATLLEYVQHKVSCQTRNDGRRWEPRYKRVPGRRDWYGAWVEEASARYDCTCGLAVLIARYAADRTTETEKD